MVIGRRDFDVANRCYIMGILNVTPDSFSDGGKWSDIDDALRQAERMIGDGADIIDVGGESTRPGYAPIGENEEIDRVAPVIEALCERFDVPISVDTYKRAVAGAALKAGAVFVNDIWGLKRDPGMGALIAATGASCCLMHNRDGMNYIDFIPDMLNDLSGSVGIARLAGIRDDKIILDPGVGFAKTQEMNLEAINRLDALRGLGFPVMLGASRKSVIGNALGLPVTQRVEGTLATTVIAVLRGCSFVRVHDVLESKRAIAMTEAIIGRSDSFRP
ncbi:MAG: dihydropteroate synthase [Oscillospiraceae bacterium]|nr:dihydropteroate synthase [Oscillospiraceae bacterium]